MKENKNRRKIFGIIGGSALGAALASLIPFRKVSGRSIERKPEMNVRIHPMAVKRDKR